MESAGALLGESELKLESKGEKRFAGARPSSIWNLDHVYFWQVVSPEVRGLLLSHCDDNQRGESDTDNDTSKMKILRHRKQQSEHLISSVGTGKKARWSTSKRWW